MPRNSISIACQFSNRGFRYDSYAQLPFCSMQMNRETTCSSTRPKLTILHEEMFWDPRQTFGPLALKTGCWRICAPHDRGSHRARRLLTIYAFPPHEAPSPCCYAGASSLPTESIRARACYRVGSESITGAAVATINMSLNSRRVKLRRPDAGREVCM